MIIKKPREWEKEARTELHKGPCREGGITQTDERRELSDEEGRKMKGNGIQKKSSRR